MRPVKPKQKTNQTLLWTVLVLCIAFFAAGAAVPILIQRGKDAQNPELAKLESVYDLMKNKWYYADQVENLDSQLIEQAITGMTTFADDPHTNYFSLEQAQAFSQSLSGSNVGIGVGFYPNASGQMVIKNVFTNSTADKGGLQIGDVIVKVGDKETAQTSTEELISFIKSMDGKPLDLQIQRGEEILDVTVTPGSYDSTVSSDTRSTDYGLITLTSFSENSGKDFADALGKVKASGTKSLILDLRSNTGGYLSAALDIASSLLPDDSVVFVENLADGSSKEYTTNKSYTQVPFEKIYILQNENTASASEVLIGALKDNLPEGEVVTIGSNTYGKGTEQVSMPFADGTSIKYTIAEWTTPNGTSINKTGFEPDVEITEEDVRTVRYASMTEEDIILPDTVSVNAAPVQVYLQYLGYPANRTDAYFSVESSEALKQFQSDHGLEATGTVDSATFNTLLDEVGQALNNHDMSTDKAMQAAVELIKETVVG